MDPTDAFYLAVDPVTYITEPDYDVRDRDEESNFPDRGFYFID